MAVEQCRACELTRLELNLVRAQLSEMKRDRDVLRVRLDIALHALELCFPFRLDQRLNRDTTLGWYPAVEAVEKIRALGKNEDF